MLDATAKPVKSDIIVCLGGGDGGRIKKSLSLYTDNYSKSNILILTGDNRSKKRKELNMDDKRIEYIKKENKIDDIDIVHYNAIGNTKVEILFIKKYMLENHFQSAIIVSDIPHTRRIKTLLGLVNIKGDDYLRFNIVASDVSWWNSGKYYKTKKAKAFAFKEFIKLMYTYVAFGVLDKIGLLEVTKDIMRPSYIYIKKQIDTATYFYLKENK